MPAKKLNLTLPHAVVVGHQFFAFKQGDNYYNVDGVALAEDGTKLPTETGPAKAPSPALKATAPTAIDPEDEIDEEIDLRGYADGTSSYPWGTVTAAIQRKFDTVVKSKREAVELINEKMPVPASANQD